MTLRKLTTSLFFFSAMLSGAASHASLLIDIQGGPKTTYNTSFTTSNYTVGNAFTVKDTITIDGLGYLDAEGDGLTGPHKVGLWDASGKLLASVTVDNNSTKVTSAQGTAKWLLMEIDDLVLTAGTYRVGGTMLTDKSTWSGGTFGNGVSVVPGYVRNEGGQGFGNPYGNWSGDQVHATMSSHLFDPPAEVPEPASMALFGLALGMLSLVRRRA